MGEPSLFCVMYWNFFKCSRACVDVAGLLVGARQTELRRGVQRIELSACWKASIACGNCLACA